MVVHDLPDLRRRQAGGRSVALGRARRLWDVVGLPLQGAGRPVLRGLGGGGEEGLRLAGREGDAERQLRTGPGGRAVDPVRLRALRPDGIEGPVAIGHAQGASSVVPEGIDSSTLMSHGSVSSSAGFVLVPPSPEEVARAR
jgi:hypothetical protein